MTWNRTGWPIFHILTFPELVGSPNRHFSLFVRTLGADEIVGGSVELSKWQNNDRAARN